MTLRSAFPNENAADKAGAEFSISHWAELKLKRTEMVCRLESWWIERSTRPTVVNPDFGRSECRNSELPTTSTGSRPRLHRWRSEIRADRFLARGRPVCTGSIRPRERTREADGIPSFGWPGKKLEPLVRVAQSSLDRLISRSGVWLLRAAGRPQRRAGRAARRGRRRRDILLRGDYGPAQSGAKTARAPTASARVLSSSAR